MSETVSGSVEAMKREQFKMLINHQMEAGDMLVVLKLDRLGRDNIDVQNTINLLTQKEIKVVCLDLPVADLSSAEGKLMLQMFAAFAEFERNRIRERTKEGIERIKVQGRSWVDLRLVIQQWRYKIKKLVDYRKVMWRKN